ncbi:MAG: hypothetical protein EKK53_14515 [Burkholderiales bacterium]|nr:MAG: hypothetical protein EKK53_14515 [Burkholderiales bacterium]
MGKPFSSQNPKNRVVLQPIVNHSSEGAASRHRQLIMVAGALIAGRHSGKCCFYELAQTLAISGRHGVVIDTMPRHVPKP